MYKLASLAAVITILLCLLNEVSLYVLLFRSTVVFIGVLAVIYLANVSLALGFFMVHKNQDKQHTE